MKKIVKSYAALLLISIPFACIQTAWSNENSSKGEVDENVRHFLELQTSVFNHQYFMRDSPASDDHYDENIGQKWKLQIKFNDNTWSAKDQGVRASGSTGCTSASTCASLDGEAEIGGCRHKITVTPDGAASFEVADSIWVELGRVEDCEGPHKHTGAIHGGTAHGTD